jgi:hypothetical protein
MRSYVFAKKMDWTSRVHNGTVTPEAVAAPRVYEAPGP